MNITVHGSENASGVPYQWGYHDQWGYHAVGKTPHLMDATGKNGERFPLNVWQVFTSLLETEKSKRGEGKKVREKTD